MPDKSKEKELYLFKLAHIVLDWAGYTDYTEEELASLVMMDMFDLDEPKQ